MEKRRIAILGSTGSIGTQALDVIRSQKDLFEAEVLVAYNNFELLIRQAEEFQPNAVVIINEDHYKIVSDALAYTDIKVFAGADATDQVVAMETVDMVLAALVGYSGLKPTLAAIDAGKSIALANKETLVVAGEIVTKRAQEKGVNLFPVDSEHSAIFQCLAGEFHNPIEKIYLTASGGPFRGKTRDELKDITPAEALQHPNWTMGNKITIDSATLMNKGLEVIEARWLFNLKPDQIDVIVHPQSIIHSMVQFADGAMKAQMGLPDMKLPILYALAYPQRVKTDYPRFDFSAFPSFEFSKPDTETFPCLLLAYEAMKKGGNMPCVLNAANEAAVHAFLSDKISFLRIAELIESCMAKANFIQKPTLADYRNTDEETRRMVEQIIG
ncbi:MAG: 1-deoxy-D-xylulose-5-phosphate reductoisomerase [Bacteroidota bacterium]